MGPTWGPPGSCRPQMGPMLAPWTLLSGYVPQKRIDVIAYPCHYFGQSTHWGRVMHICVSKLTIIGSDNGLSPDRRQAIIWTNAGILLIGPLGTYVSETLIEIHTFSFKKMHLKMSPGKWRPFCLGLNAFISVDKCDLMKYDIIVIHKRHKVLLLLKHLSNNFLNNLQ